MSSTVNELNVEISGPNVTTVDELSFADYEDYCRYTCTFDAVVLMLNATSP